MVVDVATWRDAEQPDLEVTVAELEALLTTSDLGRTPRRVDSR